MDDASRTEIEEAIKAVRESLTSEDPDEINARAQTLQAAFHKVSEALYERAQAEQQAQPTDASDGASPNGAGDAAEEEVVDAEVVDESESSWKSSASRTRRRRSRREAAVAPDIDESADGRGLRGRAGSRRSGGPRRQGRGVPRARAAHAGGLRELPQAHGARGGGRGGARRGPAGQGALPGAGQPHAGGGCGRRPRGPRGGLSPRGGEADRRARARGHPGLLAGGRALRSQRARGHVPARGRGRRARLWRIVAPGRAQFLSWAVRFRPT